MQGETGSFYVWRRFIVARLQNLHLLSIQEEAKVLLWSHLRPSWSYSVHKACWEQEEQEEREQEEYRLEWHFPESRLLDPSSKEGEYRSSPKSDIHMRVCNSPIQVGSRPIRSIYKGGHGIRCWERFFSEVCSKAMTWAGSCVPTPFCVLYGQAIAMYRLLLVYNFRSGVCCRQSAAYPFVSCPCAALPNPRGDIRHFQNAEKYKC